MMANWSLFLNATTECPTRGPTAPTEGELLELPHVVILCTVLGVASVLGTLGNSLVLLSISKFESLREIPDLFIFSLSLSDVIVTAVYQPLAAYTIAHLQQVSTNMTIIRRFLGFLSLIASITNMFGVTMERLISIRFPLKYDLVMTRMRAKIAVVCIWMFSSTLSIMISTEPLSVVFVTIYFIMTLIGTVSIYVYIFLIAKRLEDSVIQVKNNSDEHRKANSKRDKKAAKTVAIVLGVAIGCWLPFLIVSIVISKREPYYTIFLVLSVCNSSINPYIYCARSRRYFSAFVKLLGLQRAFKTQGTVAPAAYSPRKLSTNTRDVSEKIQSTQGEGETNDVTL